MKRRVVSIVLVLAMLLSMVPTSVFAKDVPTGGDDVVNYVSLGDSMTNGYGLPGYDHNSGVADYGEGAYPNQFADKLVEQGYVVNHAQLAMSGIRTEDIHWLLEFDYNDANLIKAVDEFVTENNKKNEVWDQEKWETYFDCGDYWTVNEICNHPRTDATFAHIAGVAYKTDECEDSHNTATPTALVEFPGTVKKDGSYTRAEKIAVIAKYYQENVTAADVISLSVGNGNLGVFGFGRILEAIGFHDTKTYENYNYEDVLRECLPEMQEQLKGLIAEIKVMAAKMEEFGALTENEKLLDVMIYIAVSLAMNYAGTLDAILQMNEDVEIILIPVMNTFGDDYATVAGKLTIGDLLGLVIDPLNKFIAGLPTYMQVTNHEVYKDAKFYWAESTKSIECMVATYSYPLTNPIIRDRFVESIVGYCDCDKNCDAAGKDPAECEDWEDGMIWGMLGKKVVRVTLSEIEAYEALGGVVTDEMGEEEKAAVLAAKDAAKLAYAAANADKAMSISMYLAFEKAVVEGKDNPVTLDSVFGLGALFDPEAESPFDPIMAEFYAQAAIDGAAKLENVVNFVVTASEGKLDGQKVQILLGNEVAIKSYVWNNIGHSMGNHLHNNIDDLLACDIEDHGYGCKDVRNAYAALKTDYAKYLFTAQVAATINEMMGDPAVIKILHKGYLADESAETETTENWTDAVYEAVAAIANNLFSAGLTAEAVKSLYMAADKDQAIYAIVAAMANSDAITAETVETLYNNWEYISGSADETMQAAYNGVCMLKENLATLVGGVDLINANKKAITEGADSMFAIKDTVESLCTLLVMPETLGACVAKSELAGLLALFARCVIGNGIGAHPSQAGHDTLAANVIAAYCGDENGDDWTAEDETDSNIGFEQWPVAKEIISALTAQGLLNDDQILAIAFAAYESYKANGEVVMADIIDIVYAQMIGEESTNTAAAKLEILKTVCYTLDLPAEYKAYVALAEELGAALDAYVTDDQAIAIINYVYGEISDKGVEGINPNAVADYIFETVFFADITDADRIAIIGVVYDALGINSEKDNKYLNALEGVIEFLYESEYMNDEQAFLIVNYVYWSVSDGVVTNDELREIAAWIYTVLFEGGYSMYAEFDWSDYDPSLPAADKLTVIMGIYNELKDNDVIVVEPNSELEVIDDLVVSLAGANGEGGLLEAEELVNVLDTVFVALIVENKTPEEALPDITEAVKETAAALPLDKQMEVIAKVAESVEKLGNVEGGSGLIPDGIIPGVGGGEGAGSGISMTEITRYLKIVQKVVENLRAENLWTEYADMKYAEITGELFSLLMGSAGDLDPAKLADTMFAMLFQQPGHTLEQKIRIVVVIYETLDDEGVINEAIDYVDENYYQDAVEDILAENKDTILAYIKAAKVAI